MMIAEMLQRQSGLENFLTPISGIEDSSEHDFPAKHHTKNVRSFQVESVISNATLSFCNQANDTELCLTLKIWAFAQYSGL